MQDLQEVTQDLHYENFRSDRLKRGGRLSSHGYILPLSPAYVPVCQLAFRTSPTSDSCPLMRIYSNYVIIYSIICQTCYQKCRKALWGT